jgi:8-oxo-dGTP diphosphatase
MGLEEPRPLVGVGVVFVRQGRVFLAKRQGSHGEATWASADGHLEWGETLEECARREALEELGVAVGDLRFLCLSNIIAYSKHYLDVEFLGTLATRSHV